MPKAFHHIMMKVASLGERQILYTKMLLDRAEFKWNFTVYFRQMSNYTYLSGSISVLLYYLYYTIHVWCFEGICLVDGFIDLLFFYKYMSCVSKWRAGYADAGCESSEWRKKIKGIYIYKCDYIYVVWQHRKDKQEQNFIYLSSNYSNATVLKLLHCAANPCVASRMLMGVMQIWRKVIFRLEICNSTWERSRCRPGIYMFHRNIHPRYKAIILNSYSYKWKL